MNPFFYAFFLRGGCGRHEPPHAGFGAYPETISTKTLAGGRADRTISIKKKQQRTPALLHPEEKRNAITATLP